MSEALEAVEREKQIQARWASTTLLAATSSDTINPESLIAVGFNPKKAPAIILSDVKTVSEAEDLEPDSDQGSDRMGGHQATMMWYTQPWPEAMEAGSKCCPDLTKPSTSLPTLATTRAFHLPIDDAQVGWLNHFLTNMDIPIDVHLKHQQCRVSQDAPKVCL